jgi:glycogen debranching enzyme
MENLEAKAYELLLSNKKEGYSKKLKKHYFYIAPDKNHYHQWFWDSCFHAIVMSKFNIEFAIKEIDTLFSCQCEEGFMPHIIFWRLRLRDLFYKWRKREMHPRFKFFTAEIQPPVLGITLKRIFEKTKDKEFLKKYLPKTQKFFDYLREKRDPDKDSLVSIITPLESGMDLAPHFDILFKNFKNIPIITAKRIADMLKKYVKIGWNIDKIFKLNIFDFEDVAFNTIYSLSLEDLSYLWSFIDKEQSNKLKKFSTKVKEKIIEKFWDKGDKIFYGIFHKNGKEFKAKVKTVSSLFPLCLEIKEEYVNHLIEHLLNRKEFWTPYPIPSVSRDEKSFGPLTNTRFLWRGTTWINTNWFILKGLLRHKRKEVYEKLKNKTIELVQKYGFCEFYDPFTGNPGKAMKNFGWSTLVIDLLSSP